MAEHCYADCHLCLVSLMLSVTYDECHLWRVSLMLSVTYAECHLWRVSLMMSVAYAVCRLCCACHLCWVSHVSLICWVSLCWVSLYWMSLCRVSCQRLLFLFLVAKKQIKLFHSFSIPGTNQYISIFQILTYNMLFIFTNQVKYECKCQIPYSQHFLFLLA